MAWKPIVGISCTPSEFDAYCHGLVWTAWRPTFIVLHNTSVPSLKQRPDGFTREHIRNLEKYYRDQQGWSAGPHLFVDDHRIWVFTPLTMSGVHSPSFNKLAIGIEMLGDFTAESFSSGRGAAVARNTASAVATLCAVLGLPPDSLKLHKEDPKTTHDCPGRNVSKKNFIALAESILLQRHQGEHLVA